MFAQLPFPQTQSQPYWHPDSQDSALDAYMHLEHRATKAEHVTEAQHAALKFDHLKWLRQLTSIMMFF